MKNKYYVVIMYSSHNNWENAVANRDQQKEAGKDARIFYRFLNHEVHEDIKKIKPMKEGV